MTKGDVWQSMVCDEGNAWRSVVHGEGRRMAKGGAWRGAAHGEMRCVAKEQTGGRGSQLKEKEKEVKNELVCTSHS